MCFPAGSSGVCGRLGALCCAALVCAGSAVGLELRVAIARAPVLETPANTQAAPKPTALLADFNFALAREICRRLTAKCVYTYQPFAEIIPAIEDKRIELGFGNHLRTKAREAQVAFSGPLWYSSSRLLSTPAVAERFARQSASEVTLDTLRDVRVAVVSASQQHAYLRSVADTQRLQVLDLATARECIEALNAEQADFVLMYGLGAYLELDATLQPTPVFIGPGIIDHELGGSVHIVLARDDDALRRRVDLALDDMRRDGSYPRLWRRHFPVDLY